MDSITPWLDAKELNDLADALLQPVAVDDAGTKEHGGSDTAKQSRPRSVAGSALAKASALAKKAGLIKSNPSDSEAEVRQALLPELAEWLRDNADCRGICVVDRDGDVLHSAMPNAQWTKFTVSMVKRRQTTKDNDLDAPGASQDTASVRIKVTADSYLQLIRVSTARGSLTVGLFTRNLLVEAQLAAFASIVEKISQPEQVARR